MSVPPETVAAVPASGLTSVLWLLIALPAAGAAVLLLGGKRTDKWGPYLAVLMPLAGFVYAVFLFFDLKGMDERAVDQHWWSWVPVGGFQVDLGLLLDPLSMTFVLLITGVGTLIHIYSLGYMAHDPRRRRFFAYLNLFVAAMLLLVLGNSYLSLYVGWEGVGLASYLLISFYFDRPSAATAANKAFFANRVGDVGLSLAIMILFATVGTTTFAGVFEAAPGLSSGAATAIGLMLLLGACGKSGQFPLHTWLPDAMEGPTPVSALIHAATMVTAGVYLIARSTPIFAVTETASLVVSIIGVITLIIGCVIGCAYDDIKKVLAYSTVSQIGYMFLAVGIPGAGAFAILHLLTHGFFKACMFLSAGSVMHGMNDQVDMRRFGGLRTKMPVTFACFGIGYLAIIGFPFLSGFYSKDKIIEVAFDQGGARGAIMGTAALLAAGVTAFYMTRLMVMTFFGKRRWTADVHPHESPRTMTVPIVILAIGSVVIGFLLTRGEALVHWLEPVVGEEGEVDHLIAPLAVTGLTLLAVALGVGLAWQLFGRRAVPMSPPVAVSPFTTAARNNLYLDALNEAVLMRPGQYLTRMLVFFDGKGIDGVVHGLAAGIGGGSSRLRRLQTGFVRSYALSIFGGATLVAVALVAMRA
jgi:NADH-quinone oxidoreductase subunit L